jgi:hypothetical protein
MVILSFIARGHKRSADSLLGRLFRIAAIAAKQKGASTTSPFGRATAPIAPRPCEPPKRRCRSIAGWPKREPAAFESDLAMSLNNLSNRKPAEPER